MENQAQITHPQLVALYEVSRKINSQLNFQMLLDDIMDLAIELLHAEKGVLLLRESNSQELTVQAARFMDKRRIDDVIALISRTIVKQVESGGKPVLLQNVPDTPGIDPRTSLIRHKIKSVICVPLRAKEQLIGTIYLDTTNKEHFFKEEDLVFLEGFANLAGIAIENARSYREIESLNTNLEQLVDQRTQEVQEKHAELQQAYDTLKETQLQLLRSEKMASLGMLVAGIAHEINTPLGAINANTDMVARCLEKLRKVLDAPAQDSKEKEKTLDVLDSVISVSSSACKRITGIVKTLRNFARLDEDDYKKVDLHEGLDSTLSLTAHLSRDRIRVIKKYGSIPPLRCYANQLNQVFMNILVNSCQAIEGDGTITIETGVDDNEIFIRFSDSGIGIPPEHIDKIFDPGFTTKGVGVGTGLGLSISYRIVDEHGGRIEVESEQGKGAVFTVYLPLQRAASASNRG